MRSRLYVVMGVAGCGKSTIGTALAARLGGSYLEGDAFHPPQNIEKMSAGTPLSDADRWPWLARVAHEMRDTTGLVVAGCSALKRAYRNHITKAAGEPVTFIYLRGSRALIASRMGARTGHFMPLDLLDSQFATLEEPAGDENAVTVDIDRSTDDIVEAIVTQLQGRGEQTMAKPSTGLIGLGTMGRNLALNIAEKGYDLAVYNRTTSVTESFVAEAGPLADRLTGTDNLQAFVEAMQPPRNIILMVPAGEVVDQHIEILRPFLGKDDLIIDAGNANYADTNRRAAQARDKGELFLGIGVSGGEEGARHGPSIMGGGDRAAWDRVAGMLAAISAKYTATDGTVTPCATYMGEAGSGHFVKMVHNGIEYADMQMIAEIYGIMRDGFGLSAADIGAVFEDWNRGELQSYLIEISGAVARAVDPETGKPVLDVILDSAGQKGTGRWTAIEALHLASPVTAIDAAVAARNLSSRLSERKAGEALFGAAPSPIDREELDFATMEAALLAGKIACYAQGFAMLNAASGEYQWNLPMPAIAEVWREGCIIRSSLLNDMAQALSQDSALNLMFAPFFAERMKASHAALRKVVSATALAGIAAPALAAALAYFDTMRTSRGTANMVQGQRDYFGAHSFGRLDREGAHHGPWGA